jgi:hypothetical protein
LALCLVGFPSLEDGLDTMDYSDWLGLDTFIELNVSGCCHLLLRHVFIISVKRIESILQKQKEREPCPQFEIYHEKRQSMQEWSENSD